MHILLIEADVMVRGFLVDALHLHGCQITRGHKALDTWREYDVILFDPWGNDGVFSLLLTFSTRLPLPLVILSTEDAVLQRAWEQHIPFLRMPFRLNELYALLEQVSELESPLTA